MVRRAFRSTQARNLVSSRLVKRSLIGSARGGVRVGKNLSRVAGRQLEGDDEDLTQAGSRAIARPVRSGRRALTRYGSRIVRRRLKTSRWKAGRPQSKVSRDGARHAVGRDTFGSGGHRVRRSHRQVVQARRLASRRLAQVSTRLAARAAASTGVRALVFHMAAALVGSVASMLPVIAVIVVVLAIVIAILSVIPGLVAGIEEEEQRTLASVGMVDDYPWKDLVRNPAGQATSVYNTVNPESRYYYGNCTDFVWWRVNRDEGVRVAPWKETHDTLTPGGGHGYQWGQAGNLPGWQTVSDPAQAQVGDIISFHQGVTRHSDPHGHVAYIAQVRTTGITTENYGSAQYYLEQLSLSLLRDEMEAGRVVIKRNPKRVGAAAQMAAFGSGAQVVQAAKDLIGLPYGRGQGKGSADCCWTVFLAYKQGRGISLPMSTRGLEWARAKCEYAMYSRASEYGGVYVQADLLHLSPGDILFFQEASISPVKDNITHVAIYAGFGQIIDAIPSAGVSLRTLRFSGTRTVLLPQAVHVP